MFIQGPHGIEAKDKVFLHCESPVTLTRGSVVVWDATDYTATVGRDMRGIRVTTTNTAEYPGVVGALEQAAVAGVATKVNRPILVQVYGYHDSVPVLNAHAAPINAGEGVLVQGATAAGLAELRTRGGTTYIVEAAGAFAFNFADLAIGFSTAQVFIRGMY